MWCRSSSRCSSTRVGGVEQSPPWAFEMAQRAALRSSGGISNGSGVGPFRHLPVIRAEHVSQLHAQNGITPRANRRTRTRAVEAEERCEPVAGRDRPRDVPVSDDLQRQRLSRPLFRPPHPRLRPVLDAHRRWIRDRIRRRRLRRALSLSRSWRLRGRARGRCVNRTHRREPRCPNLQQFAPRQQARLARLVVLIHLCCSPGSWMDCTRKPTKLGRIISAVRLQSVLRRVMLIAITFPGLLLMAVPARAFVGQVIDARQPRTDRERRSHCRRPPRIRSDRTGRQIRVATESGASSRIRRHPPGRGRLPPDSLRDAR